MSENKQVRERFEHWARSMDLTLDGAEYGVAPNRAWVYSDFNTDTAYKAYCAAVLFASAIPKGYALVPIEPTPTMIYAAEEAHMPFGDMKLAITMAILAAPYATNSMQSTKEEK